MTELTLSTQTCFFNNTSADLLPSSIHGASVSQLVHVLPKCTTSLKLPQTKRQKVYSCPLLIHIIEVNVCRSQL